MSGQFDPTVSAIDYDALRQLDDRGWAWEFLRRNPGYQAFVRTASTALRVHLPESPTVELIDAALPSEGARDWGLRFCGGSQQVHR